MIKLGYRSDSFPIIEELPVKLCDYNEPFGQAVKVFVDIPPEDIVFDLYLVDIISLGLYNSPNRMILKHAVALALHTLFRPLIKEYPIPCNRIINEIKLPAKGLLEEIKRVLGWIIDFRKFKISLPMDKLKEWPFDIDNCKNLGIYHW